MLVKSYIMTKKHSKHLWVRDIFGNAIIVTNIQEAIEQTKMCSPSPFKMERFSFRWYVPFSKVVLHHTYTPQKMTRTIKTKMSDLITVGKYYKYLHAELLNLQCNAVLKQFV